MTMLAYKIQLLEGNDTTNINGNEHLVSGQKLYEAFDN